MSYCTCDITTHWIMMIATYKTLQDKKDLESSIVFTCTCSGVVVVDRLERSLQFLFSRVERRSSSCFTCFSSILPTEIGTLIKLLQIN